MTMMQRLSMKKWLVVLLAFSLHLPALGESFEAGIDYEVLDKPVKTETGDKIEVRELFWYYCPHCFEIEPMVDDWHKTIPENVALVRQPAVFSKRWEKGAVFYFVMEQLGVLEKYHSRLFDAIHVDNIYFADNDDFVEWLVDFGVDAEKAENAFESFAVRIKLNQARLNTLKYGAGGVPTYIVAGKYLVNSTYAGSKLRIFKVINHLIQKESARGKLPDSNAAASARNR